MMRSLVLMLLGISLAITARAGDVLTAENRGWFDRLSPSTQTACPEDLPAGCSCGEFANQSELALRYARVQSCPHPVFDGVERIRTFTADGALVDDLTWRDGKLHGAVISYHPNGRVEGIANFDHGRQIGFARVWHDNGQIAAEQQFRDGEPDGTEIRYSRDGAVEGVVVWNHGEPDREATRQLSRSLGVGATFDRQFNEDWTAR